MAFSEKTHKKHRKYVEILCFCVYHIIIKKTTIPFTLLFIQKESKRYLKHVFSFEQLFHRKHILSESARTTIIEQTHACWNDPNALIEKTRLFVNAKTNNAEKIYAFSHWKWKREIEERNRFLEFCLPLDLKTYVFYGLFIETTLKQNGKTQGFRNPVKSNSRVSPPK